MDSVRDEVFARLENDFTAFGLEFSIIGAGDPAQGGGILTALVPVAGTDGQQALMEIAIAELGEAMNFLQIYSTVVMECSQDMDTLLLAINDVNFYCPVGSFGMFREKGQLYHKYCMPFDDEEEAEAVADGALLAFHAILLVFALRAPALASLALGEVDFEGAARQGLFS